MVNANYKRLCGSIRFDPISGCRRRLVQSTIHSPLIQSHVMSIENGVNLFCCAYSIIDSPRYKTRSLRQYTQPFFPIGCTSIGTQIVHSQLKRLNNKYDIIP